MSQTVFVSACLVGENCSYDGKNRLNEKVKRLSQKIRFMPCCPELSAGLGCPRDKHELNSSTGEDVLDGTGSVISFGGEDHSDIFIQGAKKALALALKNKVAFAVLKARSPSCGKDWIYGGSFDGSIREGNGVTCALFKRNGIKVFTEEEIDLIKKELTS